LFLNRNSFHRRYNSSSHLITIFSVLTGYLNSVLQVIWFPGVQSINIYHVMGYREVQAEMGVWDPEIELTFTFKGPAKAGAELISSAYELPPREVIEVYRIEVIPPVDEKGRIKKLRYVTVRASGKEFDTIRINSVMAPAEIHQNLAVALNLGVPLLHVPITGRIPSAWENTTLKFKPGDAIDVKVVPDEDLAEGDVVIVRLRAARVRDESVLLSVTGISTFSKTVTLDGDTYSAPPIPISLDTFDELPGGQRQSKPVIKPWVVWATNKVETTPNMPYEFVYDRTADYDWMTLAWNLVNKDVAYLVYAVAVWPHANSKSIIFDVVGRETALEYPTRPLPEINWAMPPMYYDVKINAELRRVGPRILTKSFLFHGVKGGIKILDNGKSIPARSVELAVWGVKFELR
jgi:hypothetical protein